MKNLDTSTHSRPAPIGAPSTAKRNFIKLKNYLLKLGDRPTPDSHLWLDNNGKAVGRYFSSTLTSVFQPIRDIDSESIVGFQGYVRIHSDNDSGLSLWQLLDYAASDEESVELDRLCRLLHTLNFFRQPEAATANLFLNVHARLLAAVEDNHGLNFRHVLDSIEIPHKQIVLQLPAITRNLSWMLDSVVANYRHNGFRLAINSSRPEEALGLLDRVQPDVIKLDIRGIADETDNVKLLQNAARQNVQVIFKRVDNKRLLADLYQIGSTPGQRIYVQGHLWNTPEDSLEKMQTAAFHSIDLLAA